MQPRDGRVGDPGDDVGEPCLRIDVVELGRSDEGVHRRRTLAATLGAGEEPAKSQDFRPRATPRSDLSAALFVRQIRPSSRNRVKAGQWLGDSR